MDKIVLDQSAVGSLGNLGHSAELYDPAGRMLGYFVPAADKDLYREVDFEIDEDELRRREQEKVWFTTDQVLSHLGKLGRSENS